MSRPDIEPVPEIFDIHVMAFADESAATVEALARIFAIDRDVAQRLIVDAPVVVKRAASPEIANSLLDALGELGAQVVLLPSRGERVKPPISARIEAQPPQPPQLQPPQPPQLDDGDADADDERDFFASGPLRSDPAPAPTARGAAGAAESDAWGGLDLEAPGLLGAAPAPQAVLEDSFAEPQTAPRSPRPSPAARSAPYASFAPPSSSRHVVPEARFDEYEGDEHEAALDDADEASAHRWDAEDDAQPEHDGSVESTAAGDSLELAVPLPTRRMRQPEPSLPPTRSAAPAAGAAPFARRTSGAGSAPLPDLGLGHVPPLPGLGSLPPLPPAARGGAGATAKAHNPAGLGVGARAAALRPPVSPLLAEGARAASGRGATPTASQARHGTPAKVASAPRAPAAPTLPQAAWMTRAEAPSGPDLPRLAAVPGTLAGTHSGTQAAALAAAPAPLPMAGTGAPAEERARAAAGGAAAAVPAPPPRRASRLMAILELVAGASVFAIGLQLDHSVLHGSADAVWLGLHTIALYGIGHGVYGLRP